MPEACSHNRDPRGYIAWHEAAEARANAGQKQRQCPVCKLWLWPDEWGEADA